MCGVAWIICLVRVGDPVGIGVVGIGLHGNGRS